MNDSAQLLVEKGVDQGRALTVSAVGARLGRSSANDFVLQDPLLSRHHCRFYMKPGDGLWIADLGSANETLIDGIAITDAPLHRDSVVTVGDTAIRVLADGRVGTVPVVDLGFKSPPRLDEAGRTHSGMRRPLLLAAVLTGVATLSIWAIKAFDRTRPPPVQVQQRPPPST